jgi:predicted NUDIX family NTP pyrophosphohydrolase
VPARSAGILLYRWENGERLVLLVHPGGPFWAKKDVGAWSIPKGECEAEEDAAKAALREFEEELGARVDGALSPLGQVVQKNGKRVIAFALEGEIDASGIRSNLCEIEWPPRSGRKITIPEVDRAAWLPLAEARQKILPAQLPFLDRLLELTQASEAGHPPRSVRPR